MGAWIAPSAVVAGLIVSRTLHFQKITWIGWTLLTAGIGLGALMTPTSNDGINYGTRIVAAVGAGLLFPTPMFAVQVVQRDEDMGVAISVELFFRILGHAFGIALGGTVFQNQFGAFVTESIARGLIPEPFALTGAQAEGAFGVIHTFPEFVQLAYQQVFADSLRTVWYVMTAMAGLGLASSLMMRNESMDRDLNSKQSFQHAGREASEELGEK
jgi:hypothetical protein